MANQYLVALENARLTKERKRLDYEERDKWWLNPYSQNGQAGLLDEEDVLNPLGELRKTDSIHARAQVFARNHGKPLQVRQIEVHAADRYGADVERDAMWSLIEGALNVLYEKIRFTEKQKRTMQLLHNAHEHDVTPSTYIARKEGITPRSAQRRLKTILRKTVAFDAKYGIVNYMRCVVCGKQLDIRTPRKLCWLHHRLHIENRYAWEQTSLTYDEVERLLHEAKAG